MKINEASVVMGLLLLGAFGGGNISAQHVGGFVLGGLCIAAAALLYATTVETDFRTLQGTTFDEPVTVEQLAKMFGQVCEAGEGHRIVYIGGERLYQARSFFTARLDGQPSIVIERIDQYEDHNGKD